MKLVMTCSECLSGSSKVFVTKLEVRDDGLYELTCPMGHKSATKLQQLPFEVLFEIGVHAVIDGYYREAVSSFAASMERFHEFAFRVLSRTLSDGLDIGGAWKPLKSNSERQLGAFVAAWSIAMGEAPKLLPESGAGSRSFRNDVIHKGKIPTRDEAVGFGQIVLSLVEPQIAALKSKSGDIVQKMVFEHLSSMTTDAKQVSTMCMNTAVSLAQVKHEPTELVSHIEQAAQFRRVADQWSSFALNLAHGMPQS